MKQASRGGGGGGGQLHLVVAGDEQVEQRDDGALKLGATSGGDGVWGEGLPDDGLADVGGNEQADAGAQAVSLLQELVQADDDDARKEQLQDASSTASLQGVDHPGAWLNKV